MSAAVKHHIMINSTNHSNATTTETDFRKSHIGPQWFLGTLNGIATAALIINALHLTILYKKPSGKKIANRNFRIFVVYLAVMDLVTSSGRLCLDHHAVQMYMYENHWLCVTSATALHSLDVFETNLLALVSVERFIAVSSATDYTRKTFVRHFPKFLGLFLIVWVLLYIILAVIFYKVGYQVQGASECSLNSSKVPWLDSLSGVVGLGNLIAIVTLYCLLVCKSAKMNRLVSSGAEGAAKIRLQRRTTQLNRTVGALIITKLHLWTPIIAASMLKMYEIENATLTYIAFITLYSCAIANPLLYGVTSIQYRRFVRSKIGIVIPIIAPSTIANTNEDTKTDTRNNSRYITRCDTKYDPRNDSENDPRNDSKNDPIINDNKNKTDGSSRHGTLQVIMVQQKMVSKTPQSKTNAI